jgi:phenylalanyl-tRNA synthetase beta chain
MTQDHAKLRENLIAGLINAEKYNVARQQVDLALYEQGRVFPRTQGHSRPEEKEYAAGLFTGNLTNKNWHQAARAVDFYYVKGVVEQLLRDYRLATPVHYEAIRDSQDLHPGQSAKLVLGEQTIGLIGRLHPAYEHAAGLPQTYVFELDLEALMQAPRTEMAAKPAPKFPSVTRDVAILVAQTVENAAVEAVITANGGKFLRDVTLFDVYAGKNIANHQKSLAYTLTYRRDDQTLTEEEVNTAFAKVTTALEEQLGATIR